ncbi:MFS transporter [Flavisolibacter ginsenosidimutans]|uniref:MFS transporter n=1 Tax=Flavisolibacter ginsenosidimutans TaxID=661481 RepID=A0A5B8UI72_9BACT|nr:MFS transporter [Flavisolibacter ginsenosidimutans]QEC56238.1 MFS transporter [Flavisolibacter ginsenosidimutans]
MMKAQLPATKPAQGIFSLAVIVAALGYFVDIYDLLLFSIIRVPSLQSFGLNKEQITSGGESILMWQMAGLLIGGIIWGIMGDKRGRLSVLFGSIILYSLANIANGFAKTVEQYEIIRFIAGLGLAGELGAGITLVSELTPKEKRGIATSLVAGIGLTGAVVAFVIKENFNWRICYFIGGGLGLLLLLLRISVYESGMFHQVKKQNVRRGNFFMLFANADRFKRYLFGILIGLPTWYVIGILVTFSGEFAEKMNVAEKIDPGKAVMYAYVAISIGDILVGFISQWFRSRKKALYLFYVITALFIALFFTAQWNGSAARMYLICAGLGFGTGFWAIFVTMGAEQFGTNLRATAATTIPNMVRGMLTVLILPLFKGLRGVTDYCTAGWITGVIIMAIGVVAVIYTKETFGKDLNYVEE